MLKFWVLILGAREMQTFALFFNENPPPPKINFYPVAKLEFENNL